MEKIIKSVSKDPKKFAEESSIKDLENILRYLSNAYYNTNQSLVSDEIFDTIKDILENRDPKNKFLKEIGAPIIKQKIKLPYPMGSLNKIKPDTSELNKWISKYTGPYVLSDKLDGISAQLYKDENNELHLYTRGDGIEGQNISHLIKFLIDKVDVKTIPKGTSIRGKIIISKKNFKSVEKLMANARNAAAGLVNSKKIDKRIANISEFIAYSVIHPSYKQMDQMKKLEQWKFKVVEYKIEKILTNKNLSEYLLERRKNSDYEVDGIVVIDSSKPYTVVDGNPEYGFAFKAVLDDQVAEAKVVDVLWNVSKDGYLKPTIQIEPVKLVGTTITYATAFNAKYVIENKLGPGAIIKIVRSGDVIPHILEVIKPANEPKMPDVPFKWTETKVDILVKDIHGAFGDTIKVKRIVHFFKTLGVKYIDEGLVKKLVDYGYDSIEKILSVDKKKLENISGVGEKLVTKVYDSINQQLENTNLETFMAASNIFGGGLGVKKLKLVVEKYPNIMKEKYDDDDMVENLNSIEGFSDITTLKFIKNFVKFKNFFDKINKIINIQHLITQKKKDVGQINQNLFKNESVVFTGFRNKEWEKLIENNGGKISSGVTGKTTLVVHSTNVENSSKIIKAQNLGIRLMTDEEFEKKYY